MHHSNERAYAARETESVEKIEEKLEENKKYK